VRDPERYGVVGFDTEGRGIARGEAARAGIERLSECGPEVPSASALGESGGHLLTMSFSR
jgi:hypothetical protein